MARCASWRAPSSGTLPKETDRGPDGRLRTSTHSGFTTETGCPAGVGWRRGGANGQPAPAAGRPAGPRGGLGAAPGAADGRAVAAARPAAGRHRLAARAQPLLAGARGRGGQCRPRRPDERRRPAGAPTPGCSWSRWRSWPAPGSCCCTRWPRRACWSHHPNARLRPRPAGRPRRRRRCSRVASCAVRSTAPAAAAVLGAARPGAGRRWPRCIVAWGVGRRCWTCRR